MVLKKLNSLGFAKPEADTRVVVAMSGGVDSSVVAAMLKAEGYDVIGVTLQLYDHGAALSKKGACCAGVDIHDARRIAERLNFPHYVLNYENIFKEKVIDEFADSYLAGATPVPCIRCNERIKFKDLLETAKDLNADSIEKLWQKEDWIPPTTATARNKALVAVIDTVAADLGNTRAVCRSSYIHPWFIDSFLKDELTESWEEVSGMNKMQDLSAGESATLRLLKKLR